MPLIVVILKKSIKYSICTNQGLPSFDINFWNIQRCSVFYCGLFRRCCNGSIISRIPETSPKYFLGQARFWPLFGTGSNTGIFVVINSDHEWGREGRREHTDQPQSCSIKVVQDSSHFVILRFQTTTNIVERTWSPENRKVIWIAMNIAVHCSSYKWKLMKEANIDHDPNS